MGSQQLDNQRCSCGEVYEVFQNDHQDAEDHGHFTIYTTRQVNEHTPEGSSLYEADLCPACDRPLDQTLDLIPF